MTKTLQPRVEAFCARFGLKLPILLAPMAGASAPGLSAAVARAGGMGALGALLMQPGEILEWAAEVRSAAGGRFQINLWIPDPAPIRDAQHEAEVRAFLGQWGPEVPAAAGDAVPPDFEAQCEALLQAKPLAVSSVMGLFPASLVRKAKERNIAGFAVVSTPAEARQAEAAVAKCEAWRRDYNEVRPHSAIGNKPPISRVNRSAANGPPLPVQAG